MAGRFITLRRPMLFGVMLATAACAGAWEGEPADRRSVLDPIIAPTATPAAPCSALPAAATSDAWAATPRLPIGDTAQEPPAAPPAPVATLQFASALKPASLLEEDDGIAAATLAGAGLMLLGGWRWYRSSRLPWPPEFAAHATSAEANTSEASDVAGWRLSRFDDLPDTAGAEELRPLRPLYDSLDDADIIEVEARATHC